MSTFNKLITKSLQSGTITSLISFPTVLMSSTEKKWVDWIKSYTLKYGNPPTTERMTREFDVFIPGSSEDPINDLFDQVLAAKKKEFTLSYLLDHQEELRLGKDPGAIIAKLHRALTYNSAEVDLFSTFDRSTYLANPIALPYYVPELDQVTGGLGETDLVYFSGVAATNKTTYMKWLAATWVTHNKKVLFASNENPSNAIIGGIDAFLTAWNPKKMRIGGWTDIEKDRIKYSAYVASLTKAEVIVPKRAVPSVERLDYLIDEYQPDITIIDGAYLMKPTDSDVSSKGWEREQATSRAIKQLTLRKKKPIIATLQQGRSEFDKKAKASGVGGSIDYFRDADAFLATSKIEGKRIIELLKNRWGEDENIGFTVNINFEKMTVTVQRSHFVEEEDA